MRCKMSETILPIERPDRLAVEARLLYTAHVKLYRPRALILDRDNHPLSGKTVEKKLRINLCSLLIPGTMGKSRAGRSLAEQLADFEDPTPKGRMQPYIHRSILVPDIECLLVA